MTAVWTGPERRAPGGRAPIRVERVIDGTSHAVLVTLDPAATMVTITAAEVSVTLSPEQALHLSWDAYAASEAPETCAYDERHSVVTVTGIHLCGQCAKALDASRETTS